jgi:hypothetical protein
MTHKEFREYLTSFNPRSLHLLRWILLNKDYNQYFIINQEEYLKYAKIRKIETFEKAMRELRGSGVVRDTEKGILVAPFIYKYSHLIGKQD